jgi:hypothetical protein
MEVGGMSFGPFLSYVTYLRYVSFAAFASFAARLRGRCRGGAAEGTKGTEPLETSSTIGPSLKSPEFASNGRDFARPLVGSTKGLARIPQENQRMRDALVKTRNFGAVRHAFGTERFHNGTVLGAAFSAESLPFRRVLAPPFACVVSVFGLTHFEK